MTYTYAVLDVSPATYDEIAQKLRDALYNHVFVDEGKAEEVIDLHGLALRKASV